MTYVIAVIKTPRTHDASKYFACTKEEQWRKDMKTERLMISIPLTDLVL